MLSISPLDTLHNGSQLSINQRLLVVLRVVLELCCTVLYCTVYRNSDNSEGRRTDCCMLSERRSGGLYPLTSLFRRTVMYAIYLRTYVIQIILGMMTSRMVI